MELTEFITARLDEDEANAEYGWSPVVTMGEVTVGIDARTGQPVTAAIRGYTWDANRMRREVAAKRAIVAVHDVAEHYCQLPVVPGRHSQLWTPEEGPCWTLRLLASAWADHPDYPLEWAPLG